MSGFLIGLIVGVVWWTLVIFLFRWAGGGGK
jgi:hypothetical protein